MERKKIIILTGDGELHLERPSRFARAWSFARRGLYRAALSTITGGFRRVRFRTEPSPTVSVRQVAARIIHIGSAPRRMLDQRAFEERMLERFPALFAEMLATPTDRGEPITRDGVDVGVGWRQLVEHLAERVSAIVAREPVDERAAYRFGQVKDKFASLRVYLVDETNDEIEAAIEAASAESRKTCEDCGKPGRPSKTASGWVNVRCDACVGKSR